MTLLGLSLALSPAAGAATISFSNGLPIGEAPTEISNTMSLSLFNLPGTLTGAILEIFGSGTQTLSLTNNSANNQSAKATQQIDLLFSSNLLAVDNVLIDDLSLVSTIPLLSYTPGQTRTFGPVAESQTISYDLVSILASLSGPGSFDVSCESLSGLSLTGGGGNMSSTQTTLAGCGTRITYTYDDQVGGIPEPSSWVMAGLGVAGLLAGRLRRRS